MLNWPIEGFQCNRVECCEILIEVDQELCFFKLMRKHRNKLLWILRIKYLLFVWHLHWSDTTLLAKKLGLYMYLKLNWGLLHWAIYLLFLQSKFDGILVYWYWTCAYRLNLNSITSYWYWTFALLWSLSKVSIGTELIKVMLF